jgi:hypothetical protein
VPGRRDRIEVVSGQRGHFGFLPWITRDRFIPPTGRVADLLRLG